MDAIGLRVFGSPEVLETVRVAEPHADAGEVRIRVAAATVNPVDTMLRAGHMAGALLGQSPPYIPGMEAAGVIDEVGDGVDLELGAEVIGMVLPVTKSKGAYAEYVVVPARQVVKAPKGVEIAGAATIPMNGLTALLAVDGLGLESGQWVAVTGAAGAVGGFAVQIARHRGLNVIADSTKADSAMVEAFGAEHIVERGDGVAERIRRFVPNGVDGLIDGSVQSDALFAAVRDGGKVSALRGSARIAERSVTVNQIRVSSWAHRTDLLCGVREMAERGVLTVRVRETFAYHAAADAHRLLEAGGVRGRFVLVF
ncbi:MAG: alcohol dehydrogenase [Gordonia sp.]|nr:alcohol dehydrogenase [Gordonia sp. (in: high G+C Gram-positive bacteria)]